MKHEFDIVIIGAGPSGIFAAFESSILGMSCCLIDSLAEVGGQCQALYPDKPIYDIPGFSKISGGDLISNLMEQIKKFNVPIFLNNTINSTEYDDIKKKWIIKSNINDLNAKDKSAINIQAASIIIATGGGTFRPNRPPLKNIEEFENKSVLYSVRNIDQFRNKDIVIAGGGDSAVDWAVELSNIARTIYVVHRRAKFRAADNTIHEMHQIAKNIPTKLKILTPFQLDSLEGDKKNGLISHVNVKDLDNNTVSISADYLLPFFGLAMDNSAMHNLRFIKWSADNRHIEVEPSTLLAHPNGIFAIGDICNYPGKLKLILTGFSEAALACHNAYKFAFPNKPLHFEYSTSKF